MFRLDAKLSANRGGAEVGRGRVKWNRPVKISNTEKSQCRKKQRKS